MEVNSSLLFDMQTEMLKKNCNILDTYKVIKNCTDKNVFARPFLNMLTWNVHCLTNKKLNIIKQYMDEWSRNCVLGNTNNSFPVTCSGSRKNYFIDLISFTETWLQDDSKFNIFRIKNYNSLCINRPYGRKGGGILLYVHKNYISCIVDSEINDHIEYLLAKVVINKDEWFVLTIYRPPNGDMDIFYKVLENLILRVNSEKLIINGDMNLNILNETELESKNYFELLTSLNVSVINKAVTRRNYVTGIGTLIDHVIMSNFHKNFIVMTSNCINMVSDHNFIILMLQMQSVPSIKNRILKFKRVNYNLVADQFYNDLLVLSSRILDMVNSPVNEYFNTIHDLLIKSVNENTRLISVKLPEVQLTLPKWADNNYIGMLNTLYNLEEKIKYRQMNGLRHDGLQQKFNELNEIRDQFATVKARIYYRRLEIDNLGDAWKYINELAGQIRKEESNLMLKNDNGNYLVNPNEIAEAFQNKFLTVVGSNTLICNIDTHVFFGTSVTNTFYFEEVTPMSIFFQTGALAANKASGHDNINANVLKSCNEGLCAHLANIFNNMIRGGIYPERLKLSIIKPIPKSGNILELNNSRPISILSQIDKVFESLMFYQLSDYFENNNLMDSLQYGFRPHRGCSDALCMILHHVSCLIEAGDGAVLLSFDIEKAFDTVCHRILLRKLNFMGIRGPAYNLIESFLNERKQVVKVDDSYSQLGDAIRGVPQGSNLGPLLFNLMINDLSSIGTYSTLYKYADDLIAVFPIRRKQEQSDIINMERDLKVITEYYEMNHLKVNCEKSKYLVIGANAEHLRNMLEDKSIQKCENLKYLGFIIDSELKMISQLDTICKSVAQGINALRFLKQNLSVSSLMHFFHGHIQSRIGYCSFALLRCRLIDIERLQRLQSKARLSICLLLGGTILIFQQLS